MTEGIAAIWAGTLDDTQVCCVPRAAGVRTVAVGQLAAGGSG